MSLDILRDPRIRSIEWRDLAWVNAWETARELLISLPWLLGSWLLARYGLYVPALLVSYVFFMTGLRQVHNAFHFTLGLSRRGCELVMFVLSVLMLGSMHAVWFNHLRHHRHCMDENDVEGMSARMG